MGTGWPNASRRRACTRTSSSEWPPRSKNRSCAPTLSTPSTSAHTAATLRSASVRGATYRSAPAAYSGAGSALRSSLPFAFRGSRSSATNADGTMYSGRLRRACSRSASASTSPTTYATSRRSPVSSSRTTTVQSLTPAAWRSTASISPSSMRKPRTFTWKSSRPRYSMAPCARHRARSPVRYSRAPPSVEKGSGTKRSAVIAARPW